MTAMLMVSLLTACRMERGSVIQQQAVIETAAPVSRTFALGSEVDVQGAIPADAAAESFRRGNEIYLSVNVTSASTAQKITVEWRDPAGRVVHRDQRDVPVERTFVPFSSGPTSGWPSGGHRAIVIIDGRRVTELPFELHS
jgi:hypothetical protein